MRQEKFMKQTQQMLLKKIKAFWFPPFEGAYIERDGIHFSVITKEMLSKIENI